VPTYHAGLVRVVGKCRVDGDLDGPIVPLFPERLGARVSDGV
jgi:hypothetical protein